MWLEKFKAALCTTLLTYTHIDTWRCNTLLSINTHAHTQTYGLGTCACTPLREHTQSGCKCRWEEMKAAVVLWFHLVYYIYLTLSCVHCSFLTHHTLIIPSAFWSKVRPRASYWGHMVRLRLFVFQYYRLAIHKFLFMVSFFFLTYIHNHTWELPSTAPSFCW